MSKKVIGIGLALVSFAIPFVGPAIGAAIGISALAAEAILAVGVAIASNVLLGPSTPKMPKTNPLDRLYATLDPTSPRKIVFGHTAMATDVRYQTYTGADQQYVEQIVCVASHKVHSIDEIWFDNEKAWDSTSGVTSKFSSFLTVAPRLEGTSANGIAIDSTWTASCTLTGCAYVHLKYLLIHEADDGSNDSPFATGVTNRLTIRGKGALAYDPRLDSTVTGGAGTQQADDQSTWAWDDNGARNPALQLLWYLLGWHINAKLAVGMGLPAARIDLESFITAANACDESVTLAGGGTEPRYRSDGVLSEADDRTAVVETLCATMNAVLRDSGGKLALTVLHNDLATPVASFDADSVVGEIQWSQTPDLSQTFNIVRGRRIDPSDKALYQPVDFPEATLTAPDGIDRIDTVDYPMVQSNGQAQRLAKQRLERNQYQGRLTLTGKPAWWQASVGDVIEFTHSAFGWTDKLFRVAGQQISRTGQTETVMVEENAAIYAWDNNEAAAVTPGEPTIYNAAANHPIQKGINDALAGNVIITPFSDVLIYADSAGTVKSGELPRELALTASSGTTDVTTTGAWALTATDGITATIGAATGVVTVTGLTAAEVLLPVSFTLNAVTRAATIHVLRQDDPPTNSSGTTNASTTTLGTTNGTIYDTLNAVSATLTVDAGAGGQVECAAPISFKRTPGSAAGSTGAAGKWQWREAGGTFADIDVEVEAALFAGTTTNPTHNSAGSLSVTQTKTGLTTGTSYEFRFLWRRIDGTGTVNNVYRSSGTLTATGS